MDSDGDWDTVIDKRRISRLVRRERKEAEAETLGAAGVVGASAPEFDAEDRRRRATASFYGSSSKNKKKKGAKRSPLPTDDFGEAGWTGGPTEGQSSGRAAGKKKEKQHIPQYNTAAELYTALSEILSSLPPPQRGSFITLASLGDKLQTLTRQAWNKRYKPEFGSLRRFLEQNSAAFEVQGDEVRLRPQQQPSQKSQRKSKPSRASGGGSGSGVRDEEDDEEEYGSEDEAAEDSEEDESTGQRVSSPRRQSRRKSSSSSSSPCSCKSALVTMTLAALSAAAYLYAQRHGML